jgi:hypothetical protein
MGLLVALKVSILDSSLPILLREPVRARFGLGFLSGRCWASRGRSWERPRAD